MITWAARFHEIRKGGLRLLRIITTIVLARSVVRAISVVGLHTRSVKAIATCQTSERRETHTSLSMSVHAVVAPAIAVAISLDQVTSLLLVALRGWTSWLTTSATRALAGSDMRSSQVKWRDCLAVCHLVCLLDKFQPSVSMADLAWSPIQIDLVMP